MIDPILIGLRSASIVLFVILLIKLVVGDLSLVAKRDAARAIEAPRPDLSDGARRLKPGSRFDPLLIGTATDEAWLGDVASALAGSVAGIVLGESKGQLWLLTGPREVTAAPRENAAVRRVPYSNGVFTAAPVTLDDAGQPVEADA